MQFFHTALLRIRPEVVEQFGERMVRHAKTTLAAEPDCQRFDVYQESRDPTLFLLVEIYTTEAAFKAHQSTEHFLQFRSEVKDFVVERTWRFWTKLGPD